jgi:hypothetical protein
MRLAGPIRELASGVDALFDDVAQMLGAIDIQRTWGAAADAERRVLLDEFLDDITVLPD